MNTQLITRVVAMAMVIALGKYAFAQDMNAGFKMLEQGAFQEANSFFKELSKEHPENKTARLCYGRAVGLSGEPDHAIGIFNDLLTDYPGDIEVSLNLAEAYLWQKSASSAIVEYKKILARDSSLFGAVLGIANSYSMAQDYQLAYSYIIKALELQPSNQQAAISAKFIRMGLANKLASQDYLYDQAITLLHENLAVNPEDQQTLALLANIFIVSGAFHKADSVYADLQDPISSRKGQSVALHLQGYNTLAKKLANELLELTAQTADSVQIVDACTHYLSALLWCGELKEARLYIDSLVDVYPEQPELLAAQAQVAMYEADFTTGVDKYTQYLKREPQSFKGNLGRADAMHALGMDNNAYAQAFQTLEFFPGQKDAKQFINRLNVQHSPKAEVNYTFAESSDGSVNRSLEGKVGLGLTPMIRTAIEYRKKEYNSPGLEDSSVSEFIALSGSYRMGPLMQAQLSVGTFRSTTSESQMSNEQLDIDVLLQIRVNKSQTLTLGYETEIQDFNAALLHQNLTTKHLVARNSVFWKVAGFGWYSEAYHSFYSDGNKRSLLFTSLYKTLSSAPSIKAGLNGLVMAFDLNRPENYYSPNLYKQAEVFAGLELNAPLKLMLDGAIGYQFVDTDTQLTWRFKAMVGKQFGRLNTNMTLAYSSISAAQSNGFSFMQIGAKVCWQLSKKPIFYGRITSE